MDSIAQDVSKVKIELYQENRADLLELADHALQEYRTAWANFVATGSHEAFLAAMAAQQDRADLLGEVGEVGR